MDCGLWIVDTYLLHSYLLISVFDIHVHIITITHHEKGLGSPQSTRVSEFPESQDHELHQGQLSCHHQWCLMFIYQSQSRKLKQTKQDNPRTPQIPTGKTSS